MSVLYFVRRPERGQEAEYPIYWVPSMDKYDGTIISAGEFITRGKDCVRHRDGWWFHRKWLEEIPTVFNPDLLGENV